MKFLFSLLAFCSVSCFAFGSENFDKVKKSTEQSYAAWHNEYLLRQGEAERAGHGTDPTYYHYLWYAKGQADAAERLLYLMQELEANPPLSQ